MVFRDGSAFSTKCWHLQPLDGDYMHKNTSNCLYSFIAICDLFAWHVVAFNNFNNIHLFKLLFNYMPFQYSKKHTLTQHTEEFSKRVRMIYDHLFVTLYKKSIYSSGHKQRIRYHKNPFREFPCISKYNKSIRRCLNKDCTYNTNTGLFKKVYRTIFHNLLM